ncbi:EmrB/QacA family drug resistance transporter [Pantoea alhagi]|uniref:EmrB/QacA family drug resistance transporter n=1 Tax=Pantoea alhagi TaxID=1891675 RepID=A0A1W6B716_9GAMM|nr:MFS transporter [Pantoea alhagi]ARJ42886.1 EmrB/QacA family drug resistance transporter [Pantoea alhagi]
MNGQPAAAPAPHPFTLRLALGLAGVLIAALASGLNDRVTDMALADIRAALGISYDRGSWLIAGYQAAEVAAMMIAPWFAVTLSLRRFALGVAFGFGLMAALLPFVTHYPLFLTLRVLQGIFGGALPPLLMTVALRFLPPPLKLYGLSAYALTATFGPNMAATLTAFWTDSVGWAFVFWQIIPAMLIAMVLIGWGLPQDPVRLERFRQMDLFGMLTGCSGIALLILTLSHGERLDWLSSPLICAMLLASVALLTVFLINEWFHPLPLFRLQMLSRPNLTHGLLTLAGVLLLALSGSALPSAYFSQVDGFRTAQFAPLALMIGAPQLLIAPFIAMLLNLRWIDCRWVLSCGALLMAGSCLMGSQLTGDWARQNFWLIQVMQAFGQPMMILPVLMSATSVVLPPEGPFASAMFNTVRGFSSVAAGTLVEWFLSHREQFHSHILLDGAANRSWLLRAGSSEEASASVPLLPDGSISSTENIAHFSTLVKHQAQILSISDSYLLLIAFALLLILLTAWLPKRVWPPQTLLQQPVITKPGI